MVEVLCIITGSLRIREFLCITGGSWTGLNGAAEGLAEADADGEIDPEADSEGALGAGDGEAS